MTNAISCALAADTAAGPPCAPSLQNSASTPGGAALAGGALTAFRVRVNGSPRAIVNGRPTPAAAKDGFLEVGSGP
jgi:hypothetical protein